MMIVYPVFMIGYAGLGRSVATGVFELAFVIFAFNKNPRDMKVT